MTMVELDPLASASLASNHEDIPYQEGGLLLAVGGGWGVGGGATQTPAILSRDRK